MSICLPGDSVPSFVVPPSRCLFIELFCCHGRFHSIECCFGKIRPTVTHLNISYHHYFTTKVLHMLQATRDNLFACADC